MVDGLVNHDYEMRPQIPTKQQLEGLFQRAPTLGNQWYYCWCGEASIHICWVWVQERFPQALHLEGHMRNARVHCLKLPRKPKESDFKFILQVRAFHQKCLSRKSKLNIRYEAINDIQENIGTKRMHPGLEML